MKYIIVDERITEKAEASLSGLGFKVFKLPAHTTLPEAVRSHTDMLLFKVGDTVFSTEEYKSFCPTLFEELEGVLPFEFIYTNDRFGNIYPEDARLNCLVMGKRAFCNRKNLSPTVLSHLEAHGYKVYDTKQGYPACTTLPIGDNTAFTADRGMAKVLSAAGIDVIYAEDSERILLPPHKFGFIGGCCHKAGDYFLFFGNLDSYEHSEKLTAAIEAIGCRAISLDPEAKHLFDLGGAVSYDKSI